MVTAFENGNRRAVFYKTHPTSSPTPEAVHRGAMTRVRFIRDENGSGQVIPRAVLDVVRWALILASVFYILAWIGQWHWIAAAIGALPVYFVMLNVWGFATLPLYALTPEVR